MSEEKTVGTVPPTVEAAPERTRVRLPQWEGQQRLVGPYRPPNPVPADWPQDLHALEITLWRGRVHQVGWDGREIWVELGKAKAMDPGEACGLILLQKVGAIGGIKPRESYFALADVARAHLDSKCGGLLPSSYGVWRSAELDALCRRHKRLVGSEKLEKGVVMIMGFPEDCPDRELKALLGQEPIRFYRFDAQPGKDGLASAQLEYAVAKALCKESDVLRRSGQPLRARGKPVRIEWARNQHAFDSRRAR